MATHNHAFFNAMDCPAAVTWTNDIQKMFTPLDVAHMKQVTNNQLDLSSYVSVKIWAHKIYNEVSSQGMRRRAQASNHGLLRGSTPLDAGSSKAARSRDRKSKGQKLIALTFSGLGPTIDGRTAIMQMTGRGTISLYTMCCSPSISRCGAGQSGFVALRRKRRSSSGLLPAGHSSLNGGGNTKFCPLLSYWKPRQGLLNAGLLA